MKAIFYVLAILVIAGAGYFTLEQHRKFEDLQKVRLDTIKTNKTVSADAAATESELKKERDVLASAEKKKEELTQSISALKSTGATLERDVAELDNTLKSQTAEFAELDKALKEVAEILKGLGEGVTLDNLGEKIQQVTEDKKQKDLKLEELNTLAGSAEKLLTGNRADLDRLVKRDLKRNANIDINSMEAVVSSVNQDWGFLVIGAGSNTGFTPQTTLIVKRDGHVIGRVQPSSIEPTQTIAEIIFESLAPGVRIQPGDRVFPQKPITR